MNIYEIDFTFFLESGNEDSIERKDTLLDTLYTIKTVDVYDVYDDGEDWCVNCIAEVEADNIDSVDAAMATLLAKTDETWDYHYVKGIDNEEYWQP